MKSLLITVLLIAQPVVLQAADSFIVKDGQGTYLGSGLFVLELAIGYAVWMARPPRADEAGGLYHALNRGNGVARFSTRMPTTKHSRGFWPRAFSDTRSGCLPTR